MCCSLDLKVAAPPAAFREVALEQTSGISLRCRVVTDTGLPLEGAVVELTPRDPLETGQVATTDAQGFARFSGVSRGPARLTARADGYATSTLESVAGPPRADPAGVIALSRGYRILAEVEPAKGSGPYVVGVVNENGVPMEAVLDAASDRVVARPGHLSLGPLPPGSYVVRLVGASEQHELRVRIATRDAEAIFR
jgi:hypothetical protein